MNLYDYFGEYNTALNFDCLAVKLFQSNTANSEHKFCK